jgi:hypothetical protein
VVGPFNVSDLVVRVTPLDPFNWREPVLEIVVEPEPLIVPPLQLSGPLKVTPPVPLSVPEDRVEVPLTAKLALALSVPPLMLMLVAVEPAAVNVSELPLIVSVPEAERFNLLIVTAGVVPDMVGAFAPEMQTVSVEPGSAFGLQFAAVPQAPPLAPMYVIVHPLETMTGVRIIRGVIRCVGFSATGYCCGVRNGCRRASRHSHSQCNSGVTAACRKGIAARERYRRSCGECRRGSPTSPTESSRRQTCRQRVDYRHSSGRTRGAAIRDGNCVRCADLSLREVSSMRLRDSQIRRSGGDPVTVQGDCQRSAREIGKCDAFRFRERSGHGRSDSRANVATAASPAGSQHRPHLAIGCQDGRCGGKVIGAIQLDLRYGCRTRSAV